MVCVVSHCFLLEKTKQTYSKESNILLKLLDFLAETSARSIGPKVFVSFCSGNLKGCYSEGTPPPQLVSSFFFLQSLGFIHTHLVVVAVDSVSLQRRHSVDRFHRVEECLSVFVVELPDLSAHVLQYSTNYATVTTVTKVTTDGARRGGGGGDPPRVGQEAAQIRKRVAERSCARVSCALFALTFPPHS